jgi:hypothetical protein
MFLTTVYDIKVFVPVVRDICERLREEARREEFFLIKHLFIRYTLMSIVS